MADTGQGVLWVLQQDCPIRAGGQWLDLDIDPSKLHRLRACSDVVASPDKDISFIDGICITRLERIAGPGKNTYQYPCAGFDTGGLLQPWGGLAAVAKRCLGCPANIKTPTMGGCSGHLFLEAFSEDGQENLKDVIDRCGLAERVNSVFLPTKPLWYGLWAQSPLSDEAMSILEQLFLGIGDTSIDPIDPTEAFATSDQDLEELLSEILDREVPRPSRELAGSEDFLSAIERARSHRLRLHVSLSPPGHVDLGYVTTFPHCPRCKAEASLPRWRESYSSKLSECNVCGMMYPPSETASSEVEQSHELSELLSPERYKKVVIECLVRQGCSEKQAQGVMNHKCDQESNRLAAGKAAMAKYQKQRQWLAEKVLRGLKAEEAELETLGPWFSLESMKVIIKRCAELGVMITSISGETLEEYKIKTKMSWKSRDGKWPHAALDMFFAEGFKGPFQVDFEVPDSILGS